MDRLLRLRAEVREICRSYGVPRSVAAAYLREAVELTAILRHRLADRERFLLARLERRCRARWRAVMALERDPETPPAGDDDERG